MSPHVLFRFVKQSETKRNSGGELTPQLAGKMSYEIFPVFKQGVGYIPFLILSILLS